MKIEHIFGIIMIALMLWQIALEYRMAYGRYPWEAAA